MTSELLGGRLAIRRHLGTGGFGTVYEAIDTRFGGRVAVKVLARHQPLAIYRFKREFRALAEVVHPNLVRLYDLTAEDDALYFTMELVDGIDLLSYVTNTEIPPAFATLDLEADTFPVSGTRNHPRVVEEGRLRTTFLQLARGVQALHDAGKLHCDLKPSNVLVARDGRTVLLDFGLIADINGQDEQHRGGVGTPGYVSPEQIDGAALSPATDWYSVGVMLREALAGNDQSWCAELLELARELTSESPERRPNGSEVQRRLGGDELPVSTSPRSPLFGRARELAVLREAWNMASSGQGGVVRVLGPSGIGKSALIEAFLDEVAADAIVLRGRCYEQESVPYKALDSMVDLLAAYLRQRRSSIPMPPHAHLLARMFPVLRDLVPPQTAREDVDVHELRRRASLALRALLTQLAQTRPLVCFLDDLQWGDVDSARLLVDILRAPNAPPVLLIMAQRSDDDDAPFTKALANADLVEEPRTILLSELSPDDGAALAAHLLRVIPATDTPQEMEKEAGGNPLFIHQLAARTNERLDTAPAVGLAEVVRARVARLDDPTRRLIEAVVLAGRPIDESVAIRAADLDGSSSRNAAFLARHARFVTARSTGTAVMLDSSHQRVREALLESLSPDVLRQRHLRIAEALLEIEQPDPDQLVHHFRGAGDDRRTCIYAELAADRADDALAFDRAASLRGLLLELRPDGDDRWELHERYARSLANAGRAIEAADAYEHAAEELQRLRGEHPDRATRLQLYRRMAGELTLRSGRLPLGIQRMKRALDNVGVRLPEVSGQTTLRSAGRRLLVVLRGTKQFRTATTSESSRARLEAIWSACSGLTQVAPVLGDALATQYSLEALELGDASAIVRGLGLESVFEAVIGGPLFGRRSERLHTAIDRLAEASAEPYDLAWARACRGASAWFRSDWESSLRYCDEAMSLYADRCRGTAWEIALCDAYRLPSLAYLGQLDRLQEIVPRAYAAAQERGDLFAANTLRLGQQSLTRLVADRPDQALEEADEAIAPFPNDVYLGPHYHHLYAVTQARLYLGAFEEAWSFVERSWSKIEGARFLFAQTLRIEIRHLRARAAIARALVDRRRTTELLAIASKDAKLVARDSGPLAAPTANLIRAGVAEAQHQRDEAISHLTAAIAGFERARMALHAEAARDRLGFLLGGIEGKRLREESSRWFEGQQVRRSDALVRMLVPGG